MRLIHWLGWVLLVGILGLTAALVIFVLRFDPNQYRPLIESKLSETLGIQAEIGSLSLGWKDGLAIEAGGIRLQNAPGEIPFLETESLFIRFDPFLLLRGKLILSKLSIVKPNVLLVRKADGSVNWPNRRGGRGSAESRAAGLVLLLSDLTVEGGNLSYRDETSLPAQAVNLEGVEGRLTQTVPGGPLAFDAEAKILAEGRGGEIETEGRFYPIDGRVEFVGHLFEDHIVLKGEARLFGASPQYQGKLEVRGLDTEQLFIPSRGEVYLSGRAEGEFKFEGTGRNAEELKRSLRAEGTLQIQDGAFRNLNVIDAILSRITPLPGLRGVLLGAVPETFQPVLQSQDTPFDQLQGNVSVENGIVTFPSLAMLGPDYLVEASGAVNFELDMNFQARLVLTGDLSEFLVSRVNELSLLANPESQLVVPFLVRGRWPEAKPQPDLAYLTQRLIVDQGSQLLQKGLEALSKLREEGKI